MSVFRGSVQLIGIFLYYTHFFLISSARRSSEWSRVRASCHFAFSHKFLIIDEYIISYFCELFNRLYAKRLIVFVHYKLPLFVCFWFCEHIIRYLFLCFTSVLFMKCYKNEFSNISLSCKSIICASVC